MIFRRVACLTVVMICVAGFSSAQTTIRGIDNTLATVEQPTGELILAEANELTIAVHDPGLTSVHATQIVELNGDRNAPEFVDGGDVDCSILHRADGSGYILVIPLRLGKVVLDFLGHTANGVLWRQELRVNVKPSKRGPDELILTPGGSSGETVGILPLPMVGGPTRSFVHPQARYKGISATIDLDVSAVSFNVRSAGSDVISLNNATGQLKPLRVGDALIVMTYQGVSNFTCVVVTPEYLTSRNSSCEDLLRPGETLSLPARLRKN